MNDEGKDWEGELGKGLFEARISGGKLIKMKLKKKQKGLIFTFISSVSAKYPRPFFIFLLIRCVVSDLKLKNTTWILFKKELFLQR